MINSSTLKVSIPLLQYVVVAEAEVICCLLRTGVTGGDLAAVYSVGD